MSDYSAANLMETMKDDEMYEVMLKWLPVAKSVVLFFMYGLRKTVGKIIKVQRKDEAA
jgi:hypothetical protein